MPDIDQLVPSTPAGGEADLESMVRGRYLDLLARSLVGVTHADGAVFRRDADGMRLGAFEFDEHLRHAGRDWPMTAPSMIGVRRMMHLRACCEAALREGVAGDFAETGVWRGGATIMMRGVLAAYGVRDRRVWGADSFRGLPPPDVNRYPEDAGMNLNEFEELAVGLDEVKANFARYQLLDEQVRFLPGWFRDTLPGAPIERLAVFRLDGDLYESTMDALESLYDKVSPRGFVIIDDFVIPACRAAVMRFRRDRGITDPIELIDKDAVFWRRGPAA